MKSEIGYQDIVMGSFIEDLIGDLEWNMAKVQANDSYFKQLSIEKFALESLLHEIGEHEEDTPTAVTARFIKKMSASVSENNDPNFVFSISRDAAQSILDGLYFEI